MCAAPRRYEADAGDAEQADERDGNSGVCASAGKLVAFSALAARGLRLLRSRLGLLGSGLRLLRSRLGLLRSRLGLLGSRKLGEIARRRLRGIGLNDGCTTRRRPRDLHERSNLSAAGDKERELHRPVSGKLEILEGQNLALDRRLGGAAGRPGNVAGVIRQGRDDRLD